MKSLFYYLFGIVTMLYLFIMLFNLYAFEVLDEYYINILKQHEETAFRVNAAITFIQILFGIIFVYNLGKSANDHESLLINNKEEENE